MALMFPSNYKEWLEKQSSRTINHERVKILSFMYKYENDQWENKTDNDLIPLSFL